VACGLFFLPHTIAKLRNVDRASILFDKVGLRPPHFLVMFTAMMEVVAAFGLVTGLYPRVAALIAATVLVVAFIRDCAQSRVDMALAASGDRVHAVLGDHLPLRRISSLIFGRETAPRGNLSSCGIVLNPKV
jgi:hypothetical protein